MIPPLISSATIWLSCMLLHNGFFRRPARAPGRRRLQDATRFPCLVLCFLLPFWWWSRGQVDSPAFIGPLTGMLVFFAGATFVEATDARPRLRWFLYFMLVLASTGVTLSATMHPALIIMPLLSSALIFLSLNVLRTALLSLSSESGAIILAVRNQVQPWLLPLVCAATAVYLLSQWELTAWSQAPEFHSRLLLWALFLAGVGDGLIGLAFHLRIRHWLDGSWYRDVLRSLLFIAVAWNYFGWVTGRNLGDLLVGSAFLSVGLGFALRPTVGNFAAGLILRLAHPYSLGDFVKAGKHFGIVHSIDWRSTSLKNLEGSLITLPNVLVADNLITNFCVPVPRQACWSQVKVAMGFSPMYMRRVLEAALQTQPLVLAQPRPQVFLWEFSRGGGVEYRLHFWISNIADKNVSESEFCAHLSYCLRRADVNLLRPVRMFRIQTTPLPLEGSMHGEGLR